MTDETNYAIALATLVIGLKIKRQFLNQRVESTLYTWFLPRFKQVTVNF